MIEGRLYAAGHSDFVPAKITLQNKHYQLFVKGAVTESGLIKQLNVSNRLGDIARKITLPDNRVFETNDNNAIDSALKESSNGLSFISFVHVFERNMPLVIISVCFTVLLVFSGFKWGIPAMSHAVAHSLPESSNKALSANALDLLDEHYFEKSQLDKEKQEVLREHFIKKIVPLYPADNAPKFMLHFRLWPLTSDKSIPNAFALPSGDIVVTDRFIELAQSQDEIDIVLLHEMGHVVERHSLERVIEGSAIAIILSIALGDISWIADIGVGVGSFFISSFYSRRHESEADTFAYEHSLKAKISPNSLGLILTRMEHDMTDITEEKESELAKESPSFSSYFSTHPSSDDRAAIGQHYQQCFEQGLIRCPTANLDIMSQ